MALVAATKRVLASGLGFLGFTLCTSCIEPTSGAVGGGSREVPCPCVKRISALSAVRPISFSRFRLVKASMGRFRPIWLGHDQHHIERGTQYELRSNDSPWHGTALDFRRAAARIRADAVLYAGDARWRAAPTADRRRQAMPYGSTRKGPSQPTRSRPNRRIYSDQMTSAPQARPLSQSQACASALSATRNAAYPAQAYPAQHPTAKLSAGKAILLRLCLSGADLSEPARAKLSEPGLSADLSDASFPRSRRDEPNFADASFPDGSFPDGSFPDPHYADASFPEANGTDASFPEDLGYRGRVLPARCSAWLGVRYACVQWRTAECAFAESIAGHASRPSGAPDLWSGPVRRCPAVRSQRSNRPTTSRRKFRSARARNRTGRRKTFTRASSPTPTSSARRRSPRKRPRRARGLSSLRNRSMVMVGAALLGAVALGGALAFAYKQSGGGMMQASPRWCRPTIVL